MALKLRDWLLQSRDFFSASQVASFRNSAGFVRPAPGMVVVVWTEFFPCHWTATFFRGKKEIDFWWLMNDDELPPMKNDNNSLLTYSVSGSFQSDGSILGIQDVSVFCRTLSKSFCPAYCDEKAESIVQLQKRHLHKRFKAWEIISMSRI